MQLWDETFFLERSCQRIRPNLLCAILKNTSVQTEITDPTAKGESEFFHCFKKWQRSKQKVVVTLATTFICDWTLPSLHINAPMPAAVEHSLAVFLHEQLAFSQNWLVRLRCLGLTLSLGS